MKYFWIVLNLVLIGLALPGGYVSLSPDKLRHTNPDPILCSTILLITPLFAIWHSRILYPALEVGPAPSPVMEQKSYKMVAGPSASALYFNLDNGCNGYRKCLSAAHLRLSRFLDTRSVRLLCRRIMRGAGPRVPNLSTGNHLRLSRSRASGAHCVPK